MYDVKVISENITIGNRKKIQSTKTGSIRCDVQQKDTASFAVILHEVKYVPEILINLFSLNKSIIIVYRIGNDVLIIELKVGTTVMACNQILDVRNEFVPGIKLIP
jgi:hypothetical protein